MQSVVNDLEFSGVLSRAAKPGQAQTFSLLLSMLQQNLLERLRIASEPSAVALPEAPETLTGAPAFPLKADIQHWRQAEIQAAYFQQQLTDSARLWQCLHPGPLSLHNDPGYIDPVVIENCDWHTRQRLSGTQQTDLEPDETALLDILDSLHQAT
ncbi:VC2046/SO_2500 family protein [Bowmanella yangjiangensis]|uniref:Uncharacterized protein n=1 Tax=Bowmanella yangjiangensis TaxID=2811230 RepID=A0ABS3CXE0_9ALTE|nr:VC2046/SO_2500 family protein [Bowmanella yangjiangensis]MBN7821797.1 hypothetical protein [Bowmanella yangjiangensis]